MLHQKRPKQNGSQKKRMMAISREEGGFETTEQRLADQTRAIRTNTRLSDIEIEELKRNIASMGCRTRGRGGE